MENNANPYAAPSADVRDVQMAHGLEQVLAGRLVRLGAYILDSLIVGLAMGLPAGIIGGFSDLGTVNASNFYTALPVAALVTCAVCGLVIALITWYLVDKNGQTIAKKLLGIKVVRTDGSKASVGRIFLMRNVVFWVVSVIPIVNFVIGLADALAIFRASRKTLHDQLADTIVVKA